MIPPETRTFVGVRNDDAGDDELEHYFLCGACKQPVDMRDLDAVFHHEVMGHLPLAPIDACRLVAIGIQLREVLIREGDVEASDQLPSTR